jgi:hypothetical protein
MTKPQVLLFAHHYPPENAIGSAGLYSFSRHVPQLVYYRRIFTTAGQLDRDDSTVQYS